MMSAAYEAIVDGVAALQFVGEACQQVGDNPLRLKLSVHHAEPLPFRICDIRQS
jgi:hypothetical protein